MDNPLGTSPDEVQFRFRDDEPAIGVEEAFFASAMGEINISHGLNRLNHAILVKSGPGDLVTVADEAAERALVAALKDLLPGSVAIGEETIADRPHLIDAIGGEDWCWVIDPVDGTNNFAKGIAEFGVIITLCRRGEAVMGWLHQAITGETYWGERGAGAFNGETRLMLAPPPDPEDAIGRTGPRLAERLIKRRDGGEAGLPKRFVAHHCACIEYMLLSAGAVHFCRYAGQLKPWDHAAGLLIHQEAGGYHGLLPDGTRYQPLGPRPGALIVAMSEAHWHILAPILR